MILSRRTSICWRRKSRNLGVNLGSFRDNAGSPLSYRANWVDGPTVAPVQESSGFLPALMFPVIMMFLALAAPFESFSDAGAHQPPAFGRFHQMGSPNSLEALPPPKSCWDVLCVRPSASRGDINEAFKAKCRQGAFDLGR